MKPLNKYLSLLMAAAAVLMTAGIAGVIFTDWVRGGALSFAIGAVIFAVLQMMQTYEGKSLTIKRLRRIMVVGDVFFILAALLLIENVFHIAYPLFTGSIEARGIYLHYIHNNWAVSLLIAAIFEMYTTHRISYELKKETAR